MRRIPLAVWEAITPSRALLLCYHAVTDSILPHIGALFAHKNAAEFSRDVEYLGGSRDIVEVGELVERIAHRPNDRRPGASITFDDGLAECHTVVLPILKRFGARAAFFVTTGSIDNRAMLYRHKAALCVDRLRSAGPEEGAALVAAAGRGLKIAPADPEEMARFVLRLRADRLPLLDELCGRVGIDGDSYLAARTPYLTRAQIQELASAGHVIGAHSVTHRDFQVLGQRDVEAEIVSSCETVAAITGRTPVPFAAPFTLEGLDRGMLLSIQRRNPVVGVIFGTSGLKPEPQGLLNRLIADSPIDAGESRSNLPSLLREAHVARASDLLNRLTARLLSRRDPRA